MDIFNLLWTNRLNAAAGSVVASTVLLCEHIDARNDAPDEDWWQLLHIRLDACRDSARLYVRVVDD